MTMFPETETRNGTNPCTECEDEIDLSRMNRDLAQIRRAVIAQRRDSELRFLFVTGILILIYAKVR